LKVDVGVLVKLKRFKNEQIALEIVPSDDLGDLNEELVSDIVAGWIFGVHFSGQTDLPSPRQISTPESNNESP
jgi:hypothetical protein